MIESWEYFRNITRILFKENLNLTYGGNEGLKYESQYFKFYELGKFLKFSGINLYINHNNKF